MSLERIKKANNIDINIVVRKEPQMLQGKPTGNFVVEARVTKFKVEDKQAYTEKAITVLAEGKTLLNAQTAVLDRAADLMDL